MAPWKRHRSAAWVPVWVWAETLDPRTCATLLLPSVSAMYSVPRGCTDSVLGAEADGGTCALGLVAPVSAPVPGVVRFDLWLTWDTLVGVSWCARVSCCSVRTWVTLESVSHDAGVRNWLSCTWDSLVCGCTGCGIAVLVATAFAALVCGLTECGRAAALSGSVSRGAGACAPSVRPSSTYAALTGGSLPHGRLVAAHGRVVAAPWLVAARAARFAATAAGAAHPVLC